MERYPATFTIVLKDQESANPKVIIGLFADTKTKEDHDAVMDYIRNGANGLGIAITISGTANAKQQAEAFANEISQWFHVDCRAIISLMYSGYLYNTEHSLYEEALTGGES